MFFKNYWILGQNARNLKYIKPYNNSFAKYIADSKLRTKEFLSSKGIWVPETFFVIKNHKQIESLDMSVVVPPFVVKPNAWFWGKGILIFDKVDSVWNFITSSWDVYSKKALNRHFSEILDWFYSLSWSRDKVIVEQKIELETSIELLWKYGLPDIRLIVFNMVPIMAMLRIPTKESWGKANIHAWACWAWIDIGSWKITYLTHHWKTVKSVPWIWDIRWIPLPFWQEILEMGAALQKHTSIGYLACDIVLDKKRGPLLLEVNIRPWLALQSANMAPLQERLKKVEWISVTSVEKWVRLWKDLFWGHLEEKVKNITWKKIVWAREYVTILKEEKEHRYIWNIQVSQNASFIDKAFLFDVLKYDNDSVKVWDNINFDCVILWEEKNIRFSVKELWKSNIILWKNALKWFYIDPFKYKKWDLPDSLKSESFNSKNILIKKNYEEQILKIDKSLISVDKKLTILKRVTPINLFEEKIKFRVNEWNYVPVFKYNSVWLDLLSLKEEVLKVDIWDIPFSSIYKRKKDEILNKILYLKSFDDQDVKWMQKYWTLLYWEILWDNLDRAKNVLSGENKVEDEKEFVTFQEIESMINKFNHIYWINLKLVEDNISARFLISWDKVKIRPMASVWKRELRSIIAHEVEWHYLKKINGRKFPYKILSTWTAWYISDEEWVAIYNQNRFLTPKDKKYYSIFKGYVTLNKAMNYWYDEFMEYMFNNHWDNFDRIFNVVARLKRWMPSFNSDWVFVKDVVYLNWYYNVLAYLESGGSLKDLYIGKVWIMDLNDFNNEDFPLNAPKDLSYPLFL